MTDQKPEDETPDNSDERGSDTSPQEAETSPSPKETGPEEAAPEEAAPAEGRVGDPAAAPAPQASGGGGGGSFLAILLALVALAAIAFEGLWRPHLAHVLPASTQPQQNAQLPMIEEAVATAVRERTEELEAQLSALEDRVGGLAGAIPEAAADPARLTEIEESFGTRLAELEARVQALAERPVPTGAGAGEPVAVVPPELRDRLDDLEAEFAALDLEAALAPLQSRLTAMEETLAQVTGGLTEEALQAELDREIEPLLAELAGQNDRLTAVAGRVDAMGARLEDMQAAAASARADLAEDLRSQVADLGARIDQIGGEVDELSGSLGTAIGQDRRVQARILALSRLAAALREPDPFAEELAAARALAGQAETVQQALEAVAPHARARVPVRREVIENFAGRAPMIARAGLARDGEGWVDQALFNLSGVLSVRRAPGDVPGDSVDAAVARAQAALQDDDLALAVEELAPLADDPARAAAWAQARPWVEQAEARLTLDNAAETLTDFVTRDIADPDGTAEPGAGDDPDLDAPGAPATGTTE